MSKLSGLANLNELAHQVNLVTKDIATANQLLYFQPPTPYDEYSGSYWEPVYPVPSPDDIGKEMIEELYDPALKFEMKLCSMAQTEGMNPNCESFPTAMSSLGDGGGYPNANELPQQLNSLDNSERDVEDAVGCFEPEPTQTDHAGQASNKGREPMLRPVEKAKSKLDQAGTSAEACTGKDPEQKSEMKLRSMTQTEDMNPNWESFPTAMSSLGDGEGSPNANELPQQLNSLDNSERDVEDAVGCFEPEPTQTDHAGQASNGRIKKGREPMLRPVEKSKSKLDQAGTSDEACTGKNPEQKSEMKTGSMAQTEDMNPNWESSPIAMSSLGLGEGEGYPNANELPQQLNSLDNSEKAVEDAVGCFEPEPTQTDHAGQASNGRIKKGREPILRPAEKAKSKLDQAGTSAEVCTGKDPEQKSEMKLRSMTQTEDMNPNCESFPTAMSSQGDGEGYPNANELPQQLNSLYNAERDVEDAVECFEPEPTQTDHAGQASSGRIKKGREPMLRPVEKAKSKLDQAGTSAEACTGKNPDQKSEMKSGSMAQTEDMNPNWESSPTAMSSLGEGEGYPNANELPQQLNSLDNSAKAVEDAVGCFEPEPTQTDRAGLASNGRIKKGREPMLRPVEKAKSKRDQAGTSAEACTGKDPEQKSEMKLRSMTQTEDMNPNCESFPMAMSSLGDGEGYPNANELPPQLNSLYNSERDVEDAVDCFEPEPTQTDHAGQASNKGREPMLRPAEQPKSKLDQAGISAEACTGKDPEQKSVMMPGSMAQTEDMNPNWESSPTAMSSLGEGEGYPNANELPQQLNSLDNSERDVEDAVERFEPDPTQMDHAGQASNKGREPMLRPVEKAKSKLDQAGTSAEACTGMKRKVREPMILTEEKKADKKRKKIEADRKYRANNRMKINEHERLKPILSEIWGIHRKESHISKLHAPQQKMDESNCKSIEDLLRQLRQMIFNCGGVNQMKYRLDKFNDMEFELRKLNQIKSELRIQETESILDKFKDMQAKLAMFDQLKSSLAELMKLSPE